VVEGVRTGRQESWYRVVVSAGTRALVWARSRRLPRDANTPLRAYRSEFLKDALQRIPADALTPNLLISALSRRGFVVLCEVSVNSIPRRGSEIQGSTWGPKRSVFPNRRFVTFCTKAAREWLTTPLGGGKGS